MYSTIKVGDKLLTGSGEVIVTGFVYNKKGFIKALEVETKKYQNEKKSNKNTR